jgi:hypothetical protein
LAASTFLPLNCKRLVKPCCVRPTYSLVVDASKKRCVGSAEEMNESVRLVMTGGDAERIGGRLSVPFVVDVGHRPAWFVGLSRGWLKNSVTSSTHAASDLRVAQFPDEAVIEKVQGAESEENHRVDHKRGVVLQQIYRPYDQYQITRQ